MIIGNINYLEQIPYLPLALRDAIEQVKQTVTHDTPLGRHNIVGDTAFFILSQSATRLICDAKPEYHKKYIDIQIVLSGIEGMAISTLPAHTKLIEDKIATNDIAFVETPDEETLFTLHANDFVVFFPGEIHKPLCAIQDNISTVRKVVIKIAVDCL